MKKNFVKLMPKTKKERIALCTIAIFAVFLCFIIMPVFADTASDMVAKLVDVICQIFLYIGILLTVWGIGMLVLAFKNEDADSKSRAMMLLVVSVMLLSIKPVVDSLGLLDLISGGAATTP